MLDRYYAQVPTVIVEPGTKTGVPVLTDNPKEVGADRMVNTIAAHHLYGGPCIVVDFGTSTNLENTVEALQPGALYGFAGQVDGLVDRIAAELGELSAVVATGGLAPIVVPESRTITVHEPDLTLIGLALVYAKNQ